MGEILSLTCSCGYEADDLFVGCGGMTGHDWCRDLAACSHCREVVTIRSTRGRSCPRCRRAAVVIEVPVLAGNHRGATPLDAPCPRCSRRAMKVTETGLWD